VIGRVGTCSCSCCSWPLRSVIGAGDFGLTSRGRGFRRQSRRSRPGRAERALLAHAQSDAATRGVGSVFGPTGDVSALASRTRRAPLDVPAPAPGPAAAGTAAARADRSARTGEPAPRYQRIAGELKRLGLAASPTTCARCWPPLGIVVRYPRCASRQPATTTPCWSSSRTSCSGSEGTQSCCLGRRLRSSTGGTTATTAARTRDGDHDPQAGPSAHLLSKQPRS
jgi:hypothetical protein